MRLKQYVHNFVPFEVPQTEGVVIDVLVWLTGESVFERILNY